MTIVNLLMAALHPFPPNTIRCPTLPLKYNNNGLAGLTWWL